MGSGEGFQGFTLEFLTAMLLNLCLRKQGRDFCERSREGVLGILLRHLGDCNNNTKTFINGTYFALFDSQIFREKALEIDLESQLVKAISNSDNIFKMQIDYIIEKIHSNPAIIEGSEERQTEEYDFDDLNNEMDETFQKEQNSLQEEDFEIVNELVRAQGREEGEQLQLFGSIVE